MKEEDNKQLVRKVYQSFQSGDIPSVLNSLAADVLWELPEMPNVPFGGTWKGRDEVARFFARLADVQEVVEFQPEEFITEGNTVVVLGRFTMQVKATGKQSRSTWAHVWNIHDGQATRVREYVDSLAVSQAHPAQQAT